MKKITLFITAAISFMLCPQHGLSQKLEWGDQGNGTFRNPVLVADYSDPDVIRVGKKYYLVASDFHFMGMQVLESEDMVNWNVISQIYDRLEYPGWNEMKHYAGGSWAPSIRYHDGRFWVFFCTPDEGLFMSNATDPHGPWTPLWCVRNVAKWEDPCPLWDDDGKAYLGHSVHGAGPIILHRMSEDGKELLDEGDTIYTGPVAEGTKFLKRNGYYYLIIPEGGVGTGWQTCLRSKCIYGPYDRQVVLEQGATNINGPHQGALVDTPDGEWWFYHFQELSPLGRIVHLQPARWEDNWLKIGKDIDGNGIGEPVAVSAKPHTGAIVSQHLPQTSDDFDGSLGLQWQWCHNPADSMWSLDSKKGWLTLKACSSNDLRHSRNMLTQKIMGWKSKAIVKVNSKNIGNSFGGLLCLGKVFRCIGVSSNGIYLEEDGKRKLVKKGKFKTVYFCLEADCRNNRFSFSYSLDGKTFHKATDDFGMRNGYWKGVRTGVFCYGEDGCAHFDNFDYSVMQ